MTCVFLSFNPFHLVKLDVLFRGIRRKNPGFWKLGIQILFFSPPELVIGMLLLVRISSFFPYLIFVFIPSWIQMKASENSYIVE